MSNQTSKKLKKAAILVSVFLLISLIYPLFKSPLADNSSGAAAELRFTKGAKVMNPALGQKFIAWIEYREGAYNLYGYHFETREEKKLNKISLALDTLGPVVYQNNVYWVDHQPYGWVFTKYDLEHNTYKELKTEANQVFGFNVYENVLVYSAIKDKDGNAVDVFALNLDGAPVKTANLTNDEKYRGIPSIFGNLVAFSEFSVTCKKESSQITICQPAETGNVVTYDLVSGYRQAIKENLTALSDVKIQYNTLAWSQSEGGRKAVKVYYINTGTLITVSPEDLNSFNPVLANGLIVYFVNRPAGADLEYFKFGVNERGALSWTKANKKQISISPDSQRIAWVDDRLGSDNIFYYDFQLDDKTSDQDIDGVSDAIEHEKGSNPFDPDTDHDGLTDYEEIFLYKTSPTQYDSDGDGLTDAEETKVWFTNPLAFDTDRDGYDDKTEVTFGYSPLAPASYRPDKVVPVSSHQFFYGQPRLNDWTIERQMALELKQQLDAKYGRGRWSAKGAKEWYKVVNAYVYGEYVVSEIAAYVKGDKLAIHESVLASDWRGLPMAVKKEGSLTAAWY